MMDKPEAISARRFVEGLPYEGGYFQPSDEVYLKKDMDEYIESLYQGGNSGEKGRSEITP